ncbi:MAG: monovalent cation:proton antiporter-2 (CPA2) family protein [Rhizobiaceae bacterium]|nr:monovalent cation:proton antiporter-2 (CPA2) family protein [Rhizobiaceae bacterium]
MATATPEIYTQAVILLGGAVVAAPIFKKIGLGTVLGYLAIGVLLGPLLSVINNGEDILHFAELGIVFLLFIVGLEMNPSRLWSMRRDILGLGSTQVFLCGIALTLFAWFITGNWNLAIVAGFGLALSSTAFALQLMESRGETNTPYGRKTFSILLFQDLAIIPMLAVLPLFGYTLEQSNSWVPFFTAIGAIAAVVLAGRYVLNPLLGIIARTGAQEAMIATALLVVFGSAMLMQSAGLSMALGSFLAGVLLAESSYKHELEANIEPFRGILLGLFFIAVGLSLDIGVLQSQWLAIVALVIGAMLIKSVMIFTACRLFGSDNNESIRTAAMLSQHGEFGFVIFAAASQNFILGSNTTSFLIAMVILSMALTPLAVWLAGKLIEYLNVEESMEEDFNDVSLSPVLMIGFSRIGQVASQALLAAGEDVTVIDNNPQVIKQASKFGFRIFFGDGSRKDVLVSAGIRDCKMICVCTHIPEVTNRIIDLVSSEFPDKPIYARAVDRPHTLQLMDKPVKFHTRETFESALLLGKQMLLGLDRAPEEADAIIEDIRKLDHERLLLQYREGIYAGSDKLHTKPVQPEPLVQPTHDAEALDDRSREMVAEANREQEAAT